MLQKNKCLSLLLLSTVCVFSRLFTEVRKLCNRIPTHVGTKTLQLKFSLRLY